MPGFMLAMAASLAVPVLGAPANLPNARFPFFQESDHQTSQRIERDVIEAEAVRIATQRFAGQVQRLEVRLARPYEVVVPAGQVQVQARELPAEAPLSSRIPVWLDIRIDGVWSRTLLVQLEVRAFQAGWIAERDMPAGTRLQPDDIRPAEVEIAASGQPAWRGELQGQMLQRPALSGRYLTMAQVIAAPAVARGERVALHARSGGIEVVAQAMALQDGQVGERVQVRVDSASGPVLANVIEPGVVEMHR